MRACVGKHVETRYTEIDSTSIRSIEGGGEGKRFKNLCVSHRAVRLYVSRRVDLECTPRTMGGFR